MASPNEKNSRQRSWPDYALFVAALVFCAFSARAFSRASPRTPAKETNLSRSPASIAAESSAENPAPKKQTVERSTRIVELRCFEANTIRTQTEASLMRITAPRCAGKILRATNLTTGESLLLFERNENISTHYFPLKSGLNKILVEWKGAKKSAKTLEVEKAP